MCMSRFGAHRRSAECVELESSSRAFCRFGAGFVETWAHESCILQVWGRLRKGGQQSPRVQCILRLQAVVNISCRLAVFQKHMLAEATVVPP